MLISTAVVMSDFASGWEAAAPPCVFAPAAALRGLRLRPGFFGRAILRLHCRCTASRPHGLPPPNRNRLLPISIAQFSGRNPRILGFGWGRSGWGVVPWGTGVPTGSTPTPDPSPQEGGEVFAAPSLL